MYIYKYKHTNSSFYTIFINTVVNINIHIQHHLIDPIVYTEYPLLNTNTGDDAWTGG